MGPDPLRLARGLWPTPGVRPHALPHESLEDEEEFTSPSHPASGGDNALGARFHHGDGQGAREAAKTSIASGEPVPVPYLEALVQRFGEGTWPSDAQMGTLGITRAPTEGRRPEEQHNVAVARAYVYATETEGDSDYHLILCAHPDGSGPLFTAEVSGLPAPGSSDYAALRSARAQAEAALGFLPPVGRYQILPHPLPISVAGSLFWDVDHTPGTVGPTDHRTQTRWEIHPVTAIHRLP